MYHITIKKEIERETWTEKHWTTLEVEYDDEGREKPKKGYTPQEKEKKVVQVVILDQMVDELDLPKVIAAVNGLELK